jgi:hypothetical protein
VEVSHTNCEYARRRHEQAVRWLNRWSILVYAIGIGTTASLVVAIVSLSRSDYVAGTVTGLGTIVQGAATTWVLARRGDAKKEEVEAYADVKLACTPPATAEAPTALAAAEPWSPGLKAIEDAKKLRKDVLHIEE